MSSGPIRLSRRGLMFVLSSPSGAGKSTLARLLLSEEPDLILSISVTTRQRRASEVDGQHYHFIDEPTFLRMREHGELLESAEVHGNYYGTPRAPVEKALEQGKDVLFDIDWQGTEQLSQNAEHASDLVRVFVLPPNFRELKARLERRAEDSSDTIRRRLSNARLEIGKWTQYDYVVVNEDLGESYPMARAILRAERVRRARVVGLGGFVEGLLQQADEAVSMMEAEAGETPEAQAPAAAPPPEEPVPDEPTPEEQVPEEQVPEELAAPDDEPDVNGAAEQAVIAAVAQERATPSESEPLAEEPDPAEVPDADSAAQEADAEAGEALAEAGDAEPEPDEPDAGGGEAEAAESEPGSEPQSEPGPEPHEDPDKT